MKFLKAIFLFLFPVLLFSQNEVGLEIDQLKQKNITFAKTDLFSKNQNRALQDEIDPSILSKGNLLQINSSALRQIQEGNQKTLEIKIPQFGRNAMDLELVEHDIFTEDFNLFTASSPKVSWNYTKAKHYKGIIKGNSSSVVALSIFEDQVMGLISSSDGNLVLGPVEGSTKNTHILYKDQDLNHIPDFSCDTPDDDIQYKAKDLKHNPKNSRTTGDCIRLYIEIDDDIVNQKGGVSNATDYVTALFNQSIILFANESLEMVISEIFAWDNASPYNSTSSSGMLNAYQSNTGSFNGDLSHLVSYKASGGIAAGFSGICNSNVDNSKCFSSISSTFSNVPTYSWSVMVITHEMGHLIGSRHTHACVWNGNNTAIDGCAGSTEGSCSLPGNPSGGGTIMSYCHITSVGINLSLGFGTQPGNVIRNTIDNSSCTISCGPPTCTDGIMNGDETGVDCGGSVCPACPTCTDGIMNGDETGIDCGGSVCDPCPCLGNEVTLTINLDNYPEETSWDIQNDAGDVVASGGTYGSQPDGSQVVELACLVDGCYDFTIYDSYGDGICCAYGTGDYTLTDDTGAVLAAGAAFGSSETTNFCLTGPAPTCTDGIMNGDETGIDCGGSVCPPCNTGGCTYELIDFNNFDSGWGIWNDGGSDCRRNGRDAAYANSGTRCVRLRDNTATSTMTTDDLDLSSYDELTVDFNYITNSMDNANEDFWLQVSLDGGASFNTVEEWNLGDEFTNGTREFDNVVIDGPFTANTQLRFRCDASGNSDWVYIDDVEITGCSAATTLPAASTNIAPIMEITQERNPGNIVLYPNPGSDQIHLKFNGELNNVRIVSSTGHLIREINTVFSDQAISVADLHSGVYFILIEQDGEQNAKRFVKL